jgi:hypothetical protein
MNLLTILGIAFGLAMDAFAVAIAVGSRHKHLQFRPVFRLSFHFGLFQFLMPIIGWLLGSQLEKYLKNYDHWIAFLLLAFVGGKMIKESFETSQHEQTRTDLTRKWSLMMLSVATSIDALAVGLTYLVIKRDYRRGRLRYDNYWHVPRQAAWRQVWKANGIGRRTGSANNRSPNTPFPYWIESPNKHWQHGRPTEHTGHFLTIFPCDIDPDPFCRLLFVKLVRIPSIQRTFFVTLINVLTYGKL